MENNYFETLNKINVSDKTEKKNGLTYLSWAWAWGEIKKLFPDTTYKVYEREDGRIYWDDGKTAWVKVSVICNGIEHIEYLPIMDNRNKSSPVENIDSFQVNTSIQRALTKAIGRHGLGLYIYAGEDLPEELSENKVAAPKVEQKPVVETTKPLDKQEKPLGVNNPASQKQRDVIVDLASRKNVPLDYIRRMFGYEPLDPSLDKFTASNIIDYLMKKQPEPKDIKVKDVDVVKDAENDEEDLPF